MPILDRTRTCHSLWFQVQQSPFWTNLAFACKIETFRSLYSNALLILTKSLEFKNQVVHKQKFKDPLSSTYLTSSERDCWIGLGIRGFERPGFYPHGGNILSLVFFNFHVAKTKISILAFSSSLWKTPLSIFRIPKNIGMTVYNITLIFAATYAKNDDANWRMHCEPLNSG